MLSIFDCLIAPVMTEKSTNTAKDGVHVFQVHTAANKTTVKTAVEMLFKVKVAKVNILNRPGKKKVFRGRYGNTAPRKFAIVTLSEGSINFEGGF